MLKTRLRNHFRQLKPAACLLLVLFVQTGKAQHRHQTPEYAPALNVAALPAPPLMTGIGTSEIKITTKSATAQKYFNQGLNLLHAFWDTESYRAFREAARNDENCALCYWGIYNALGQNSQEMADERAAALKKAVALAPTVSDHEQFYIRAISLLAEPGKGRAAWIGEMEALIDKYPNDIEAKLAFDAGRQLSARRAAARREDLRADDFAPITRDAPELGGGSSLLDSRRRKQFAARRGPGLLRKARRARAEFRSSAPYAGSYLLSSGNA
jgi:hypothetical protein